MGEIRKYGSFATIIGGGRIRLDISFPAQYDAELVAYNAMGCLAEYIGNIGDVSRKYEVVIQQKPEDVILCIREHIQALNNKGYNISLHE